jgi:hypothetical protein
LSVGFKKEVAIVHPGYDKKCLLGIVYWGYYAYKSIRHERLESINSKTN